MIANSYSSAGQGKHKLSVGFVLKRTFSIFFGHLLVFWGLCIVSNSPGAVISLLLGEDAHYARLFSNLFFGLAIQGAVTYGVLDAIQNRPVRFDMSLSRGFAQPIPLFSVSLVFSVFIVLYQRYFFLPPALYSIPFLNFLVPIVLWCEVAVSIPACAAERLDTIRSFTRSAELAKGCRLKMYALYSLFSFFILPLTIMVNRMFVLALWNASRALGEHVGKAVLEAGDLFFSSIPVAIVHVMTAVIYNELRQINDKRIF